MMKESEICKTIEKLYFDNKYEEVIGFWEKNRTFYSDFKSEFYNKILEAVEHSFFEKGMLVMSLKYVNKQIKQIESMEIPKQEKEKKVNYYFLKKINRLNNMGKIVAEYKTLKEYNQKYGNDDQFLKISNDLEIYFYLKLLKFNKYLGYFIMSLIILFIIFHFSNMSIPNNIYKVYNIFTIIGLFWILINTWFPSLIKKYFIFSLKSIF